jgi:hypothetical protein
MANYFGSSAQQIPGDSHFLRIGIGQREITTANEIGYLERQGMFLHSYCISTLPGGQSIRSFLASPKAPTVGTAMNRFHIQGMPKYKINAQVFTEIGYPIPAMHALDTDHDIIQVGL